MFGRLAMGFANVRAGTRVLMLVLVQALLAELYNCEAAYQEAQRGEPPGGAGLRESFWGGFRPPFLPP